MIGRRAIFGLFTLGALAFSAIAAGGASAGLTAFTCVNTAPSKEFKTEHCVPGETGTAFGHVAFSEKTHFKIINANTNETTTGPTNMVYKETIAATNFELESTGAIEGRGTLTNEEVGGVMRASAETNANGITFHGVIVKAPAGKGCKVFEDNGGVKGAEGVVKTKALTAHTIVSAEGHEIMIEPVTPNVLTTFFVECEKGSGVPEELEGTWEVTGSDPCTWLGAKFTCKHLVATGLKKLFGKGFKAGLALNLTLTGGKFPETEPTHPITVTTTTP